MIYIALGGNLNSHLGPPARTLAGALARLEKNGVNMEKVSPYYVTPAWPDPSDPPFVNAVAQVNTALNPGALMSLLHLTETFFGRLRSARNAPRTLDLDLLDYDGLIQAGPPHLPHPRLTERGFVLVPLADVAPAWRQPGTGVAIADLIAALPPADRNLSRLTFQV